MPKKTQLETLIEKFDAEIDAINAKARTEVAILEAAKRRLVQEHEARRRKPKAVEALAG